MRNRQKSRQGVTLVEMLVVVAILGIILAAFGKLFNTNLSFFRRIEVRRQVTIDARVAFDAIGQRLRTGQANTVLIDRLTTTSPPNSQIRFKLVSGADCRIYVANDTLYIQDGTFAPKVVAAHVTGLSFSNPDTDDPAILSVSMLVEAPYDNSEDPTHVSTVNLPNQIFHMAEVH